MTWESKAAIRKDRDQYKEWLDNEWRDARIFEVAHASLLAAITSALGYTGTPEEFIADIARVNSINERYAEGEKDADAVERLTGLETRLVVRETS